MVNGRGCCCWLQRRALATQPVQQVLDVLFLASTTAGARLPSSPLGLLASLVATFYLENIICSVYVYFYMSACSHEFVCTSESHREQKILWIVSCSVGART